MGCWGIGGQYGPVAREEAHDALRAAHELGINLFDTADAYGLEMGTSEQIMGEVLPAFRDEVYLATKVGNWGRRFGAPLPYTHPTHIIGCCHASLYRLQTDVIDLYQCHIEDLDDPGIFLEAMEKLREEGKIRAYGLSTNSLQAAKAFHRDGNCAVVQLDYSILNRTAEADLLPWCQKNNIGTLARGPLAQGILTGKFSRETTFTDTVRAKWNEGTGRQRFEEKVAVAEHIQKVLGDKSMTEAALPFCLGTKGVTCLIPGAKSRKQITELAQAVEGELEVATRKAILDLSAPA